MTMEAPPRLIRVCRRQIRHAGALSKQDRVNSQPILTSDGLHGGDSGRRVGADEHCLVARPERGGKRRAWPRGGEQRQRQTRAEQQRAWGRAAAGGACGRVVESSSGGHGRSSSGVERRGARHRWGLQTGWGTWDSVRESEETD